jgi:hypothetical protein
MALPDYDVESLTVLAEAISDAVTSAPTNPGLIRAYRVLAPRPKPPLVARTYTQASNVDICLKKSESLISNCSQTNRTTRRERWSASPWQPSR